MIKDDNEMINFHCTFMIINFYKAHMINSIFIINLIISCPSYLGPLQLMEEVVERVDNPERRGERERERPTITTFTVSCID